MSTLYELAPGRFAHASGALWLASERTVIVADAHLGYGWAQRRRGELGPVLDTKSQPKMQALVGELQPRVFVFLGDLVHAPKPGVEERQHIEAVLKELALRSHLILVRGNHDRGFARDFGHIDIELVARWQSDGVTALHGDRLDRIAMPEGHLVLGHLHPVLKVKDAAGASAKIPLFVVSARATVMPAFSPYSAGRDVSRGLPRELRVLIGKEMVTGVAVTGNRAMAIGALPVHF